MPKGWLNKTISFKEADPTDNALYKFAAGLPNCTNDVKELLDTMKAGNHKSFKELVEALTKPRLRLVPEFGFDSHEFTGMEEAMLDETVIEVDAEQFL